MGPKRDISHRETPSTNITRLYFIRVATTTPRYGLDLLDSYCLDGESKTVSKCQIEIITPNPMMPILRFMKGGRLLLDDEITAPPFFELNNEWWNEKAIEEEITHKANRSDQLINLKLRRELCLDTYDKQKFRNIAINKFPIGGNHARELENLGRYKTVLCDGYGDVWLNKTHESLYNDINKKELETRLLAMTGLKELLQDSETSF